MHETYTLYQRDGTYQKTMDCVGLQRMVESQAKKGNGIGYFMETLGPQLAPFYFNAIHDAVSEYLAWQREVHRPLHNDISDHAVEVNAIMDTIDFLLQEEERIASQN